MTDAKYKTGQVWNYHTRLGEEGSKVYVVRSDPNEKFGTIYHIYVDGLTILNPHSQSGFQHHLPHSPVSQKTLDKSVTTPSIEHADDVPDFFEGYSIWKEAFDKGKAGVFTIPVKQIVQYIEDIVTGKSDKG